MAKNAAPLFHIRQRKPEKWGRPGNEATMSFILTWKWKSEKMVVGDLPILLLQTSVISYNFVGISIIPMSVLQGRRKISVLRTVGNQVCQYRGGIHIS